MLQTTPDVLAPDYTPIGLISASTYNATGGFFLRTMDGGNTWDSIKFPKQGLSAIYDFTYRDKDKVLAVTRGGVVYYSNDNGTNWSSKDVSGASLNAIQFSSPKNGYMAGFGGVYVSNDSGNTWNSIPDSITNYELYLSVYFLNNTGMACGVSNSLLRSTDAGINWQRINLPTPSNTTLQRVIFSSPANVIIIGGTISSPPVILHSTDSGKTFLSVPVPNEAGANNQLYSVYFSTAEKGVITILSGGILITSDGGSTWTYEDANSRNVFLSTTVFANNTLFACGQMTSNTNVVLLKSVDFGLNWTPVPLPSNYQEDLLTKIEFNKGSITK
ncbi:MAG: YCF48-related protein [Phycisphaerales bacterium]|nr:YCF48-related protein [Phycisphaerales bacterium]